MVPISVADEPHNLGVDIQCSVQMEEHCHGVCQLDIVVLWVDGSKHQQVRIVHCLFLEFIP